MSEHDLKVWPSFWADLESGRKTFEVRPDDRGFTAGDTLRLREWNPGDEEYTGREVTRTITYVLRNAVGFGVRPGFAVLALEPLAVSDPQSVPVPRDLLRRLQEHASLAATRSVGSASDAAEADFESVLALLAGVPVATDEPAETPRWTVGDHVQYRGKVGHVCEIDSEYATVRGENWFSALVPIDRLEPVVKDKPASAAKREHVHATDGGVCVRGLYPGEFAAGHARGAMDSFQLSDARPSGAAQEGSQG